MFSTRSRSHSSASVEWIIVLSALPDLPLSTDKENWKPMKDCWRQILLTEPEKIDSNFTVYVKTLDDSRRRCASCAFKAKRAAEKIFRSLAGRTWFGSQLQVKLFEKRPEQDRFELLESVDTKDPAQLDAVEDVYPTKDDSHIRPVRTRLAAYPPDVPQELQDINLAQSATSISPRLLGSGYCPCPPLFHPPTVCPAYPIPDPLTPLQVPPNSPDGYYKTTVRPIPQQPLYFPSVTDFEPNTIPVYQANRNGLPVNISHGSVSIQPTAVFVKNIAPRATQADVESLFAASGKITRCELFSSAKQPRTRPKTANILFISHAAAVDAHRRFNNFDFMQRIIVVKLDTGAMQGDRQNGEPSTRRGPIIADGSGINEL